MAKHIEAEWRTYAERVVPRDAPEVQMLETRRAFYAGAWMLLDRMMRLFDEDREPTDADLRMMDEIQQEVQQFLKDVEAGRK